MSRYSTKKYKTSSWTLPDVWQVPQKNREDEEDAAYDDVDQCPTSPRPTGKRSLWPDWMNENEDQDECKTCIPKPPPGLPPFLKCPKPEEKKHCPPEPCCDTPCESSCHHPDSPKDDCHPDWIQGRCAEKYGWEIIVDSKSCYKGPCSKGRFIVGSVQQAADLIRQKQLTTLSGKPVLISIRHTDPCERSADLSDITGAIKIVAWNRCKTNKLVGKCCGNLKTKRDKKVRITKKPDSGNCVIVEGLCLSGFFPTPCDWHEQVILWTPSTYGQVLELTSVIPVDVNKYCLCFCQDVIATEEQLTQDGVALSFLGNQKTRLPHLITKGSNLQLKVSGLQLSSLDSYGSQVELKRVAVVGGEDRKAGPSSGIRATKGSQLKVSQLAEVVVGTGIEVSDCSCADLECVCIFHPETSALVVSTNSNAKFEILHIFGPAAVKEGQKPAWLTLKAVQVLWDSALKGKTLSINHANQYISVQGESVLQVDDVAFLQINKEGVLTGSPFEFVNSQACIKGVTCITVDQVPTACYDMWCVAGSELRLESDHAEPYCPDETLEGQGPLPLIPFVIDFKWNGPRTADFRRQVSVFALKGCEQCPNKHSELTLIAELWQVRLNGDTLFLQNYEDPCSVVKLIGSRNKRVLREVQPPRDPRGLKSRDLTAAEPEPPQVCSDAIWFLCINREDPSTALATPACLPTKIPNLTPVIRLDNASCYLIRWVKFVLPDGFNTHPEGGPTYSVAQQLTRVADATLDTTAALDNHPSDPDEPSRINVGILARKSNLCISTESLSPVPLARRLLIGVISEASCITFTSGQRTSLCKKDYDPYQGCLPMPTRIQGCDTGLTLFCSKVLFDVLPTAFPDDIEQPNPIYDKRYVLYIDGTLSTPVCNVGDSNGEPTSTLQCELDGLQIGVPF